MRPLIANLVAVLAAVTALPAHSRSHIDIVAVLPVEAGTDQPLTVGTLNGHPVRVLIDTGFNISFVWRSTAERLGLRLIGAPRMRMVGLGGESRVDATFIDALQVQSFIIKRLRVAVAGDLPSSSDVIFGEDFLGRRSVEFDLRHGVVRTMETADCTPVELPYW